MRLDYLDIGTSDFDIGNGSIEDGKTYLLVEPVKYYLDNIPNKSNILKVNCAISDLDGFVNVYCIEEHDIEKYKLPYWVRGCNKINSKHPTVVKLLKDLNISEDIISCKEIKSITFNTLIKNYNIESINNLKIDTEGHDHVVLNEVTKCLLENFVNIENIKLEYLAVFGNTKEIDSLCDAIKHLYPVQNIIGENIHLSKT